MNEKCKQCGSDKIIPNVFVVDKSVVQGVDVNLAKDAPLQVRIQGNPGAWIFKDSLYGDLTARICGECGFTELHVKNPHELYEKYLRTQHSIDS